MVFAIIAEVLQWKSEALDQIQFGSYQIDLKIDTGVNYNNENPPVKGWASEGDGFTSSKYYNCWRPEYVWRPSWQEHLSLDGISL